MAVVYKGTMILPQCEVDPQKRMDRPEYKLLYINIVTGVTVSIFDAGC